MSAIQWIIFFLSCLVFCASTLRAESNGGHVPNRSRLPSRKLNILAGFLHIGKSHFDMFLPYLEELALRGHEVTVISYFPRDNKAHPLPNYRDISLVKDANDVFINLIDLRLLNYSSSAMRSRDEILQLRNWALMCCDHALNHPDVLALIKSDAKFDLIVTEVFNSDCLLGFVHRFKAPFISLSSHQLMPWAEQRFANDDNPSYVPDSFVSFGTQMTFYERLINALAKASLKIIYELGTNKPIQAMVEKAFGPGVPPLRDIARNTSAVLVNTHFSLQGARPHQPGIVEVGGLHISSNVKPLPDEIQRFLDSSKEGVLVLSLGSMIKMSTMPDDKLEVFRKVIRTIPRKVIWKWETEVMPDKPENLMLVKWLPQAAILRHPNVKCYMAHGGLLGLSEGVQAGVPMVIMPMFGDQFHNAAAARSRGVAEVLEWGELSEETLRTALDRIFNDTRYAVNARALSRAYLDRPETPLETAVWWTEYIARGNGNHYLRSAAQDLTWYQYYLLDVVLFLLGVVLLTAYVIYRIVRLLFGVFRGLRNVGKVLQNGSVHKHKKTVKRE